MCGYVGFTRMNTSFDAVETIKVMSEKIAHRGPDDAHYYIDENIALGFRRLSILDLSLNGQQPMVNENKDIVMVFNGEIYNHRALRDDLEALGYKFKSSSDSEVILHGYQAHGLDFLKGLSGMFTITLWDLRSKSLYMLRDSFGIKPVYYHMTNDGELIFGSEIKGILEHPSYEKKLNRQALKPYLMTQSSSMEETFFKDIFILTPGHLLSFIDHDLSLKAFDTLSFCDANGSCQEEEKDLHQVIEDAVESHAQADVKVGAFLSGGVDSSYITALLKPDITFSVGFENDNPIFNETNEARVLSDKLGIKHLQKIIEPDEFFDALGQVQYHMDEPHANLSAVPLYFLSALAKEHVTVVLSGEGSDELFAGYDAYKKSKYHEMFDRLPLRSGKHLGKMLSYSPRERVKRFGKRCSSPLETTFIGQADIFMEEEVDDLLNTPYATRISPQTIMKETYASVAYESDLVKMQTADLHHWLPNDILQKADKMSMAHSLELRVPFLSKDVFHKAKNLREEELIHEGVTKYSLRKASQKVLPDDWAFRPKLGFPVPFSDWMRKDKYYELVKESFTKAIVKEIFDQDHVLTLLEQHFQGKKNNGRKIYTIYCFLVWYDAYFGEGEEGN